MGKSNHDEGGGAHGDGAPDGGDVDVEGEEDAGHDGHHDYVVGEGPEEVHLDEEVAPFEEPDHGEDLVDVFGEDDDVGGVDVELGLGVDADADAGLLQAGDVVEPVPDHYRQRPVVVLYLLYPLHLIEGALLRVLALEGDAQVGAQLLHALGGVAREDVHEELFLLDFGDHVPGLGPQVGVRVEHDHHLRLPVDRQVDLRRGVGPLLEPGHLDPVGREDVLVPEQDDHLPLLGLLEDLHGDALLLDRGLLEQDEAEVGAVDLAAREGLLVEDLRQRVPDLLLN